jgi:uncharacterized protein
VTKFVLGRIIGRVTTTKFSFLVEEETKKFDYCQVYHKSYDFVLCQVVELERTTDTVTAQCIIIGYRDTIGRIKQIGSPFEVGAEVLRADDEFIKQIVTLGDIKRGAYMGLLEGTMIPVYLDLNKLLTKHVAVLAKSGSGKSYCVGVLLEEIMDKNVPLLIIDPHGEYLTLRQENDSKKELALMAKYAIKPKSFGRRVVVYGDAQIDSDFKPLTLSDSITPEELINLLPTKLSNNQLGLLYSVTKDLQVVNLDTLLKLLEADESNLKWNLVNVIEHLRNLKLFSSNPTSFNELIQSGRCSIINLKGIDPSVQDIILYKLLKDLFHERKINRVPPFFMVIEEAHNFVPEKGYTETRCSKIIKTIASEGRKFGLGLCVVSQRPAIVQKTVLSQCTTQIILKVTNPNDLKAIVNSVEGISYETEDVILNLPVGVALVTGVVDTPLLVGIRPRKTKHGGEAVDILGLQPDEQKFFEDLKEFKDQKLMPLIIPAPRPEGYKTTLLPCTLFLCESKGKEFNLLVEMVNATIVQAVDAGQIRSAALPLLEQLSREELRVLQEAYKHQSFSIAEFIQKTGLPLETESLLKGLVDRGYLRYENQNYQVSDRYILSDLSKHAWTTKIEQTTVSYDSLLEKKQRIDIIKQKLTKFATVKDQRECYLVYYRA